MIVEVVLYYVTIFYRGFQRHKDKHDKNTWGRQLIKFLNLNILWEGFYEEDISGSEIYQHNFDEKEATTRKLMKLKVNLKNRKPKGKLKT